MMNQKNSTKKRHKSVTSLESFITSSDKIICPEKLIEISDEKLKNLLSRAYEQARRDANKSHWYKHYVLCFSFGINFLIPLLTTDIENEICKNIFGIVCIFLIILGIVMMGWDFSCKDKQLKHENVERDLAVENIMKHNVLVPISPEVSDNE